MTTARKSANAETIFLDVNTLWGWYWAGKAHVTPPNVDALDQLVSLWNWLMSNDFIRGAASVVVALWLVLLLIDSLISAFQRGGGAIVAMPTAESNSPPAELTGGQLRAELDRLRKSQGDLAAELRVDRSYVSHLIRGKKPFSPEMQQRCRDILDGWKCDRSD
jgi:hypothetical protein